MTSHPAIEVFATGFEFPEGPTWHDGSLWVSDVIAGGVMRIGTRGEVVERHLDGRRGIGGLLSTLAGRLLATGAHLVDVETGGIVVERPPQSTGFNDIGVDADGAVLVGVLTYRPLAGDAPTAGSVARLDGERMDWDWLHPITWPNGIGTLHGGKTVIADFYAGALWSTGPGGEPPTVLCRSGSGHYDGLCIDDDDHIWVATGPGGTIEQRDRAGRLLDEITVPADFVTSVCFSGSDPRTLLATVSGCSAADGGGAVLAIPTRSAGHPPAPARLDPAVPAPSTPRLRGDTA